MSKPNKNKLIKPLEGYTAMSDDDVVSRGTAVVTGLTGNTHFTTLPVDLVTLKANVDSFHALTVEAQDGSRKVITRRTSNGKRLLRCCGCWLATSKSQVMEIWRTLRPADFCRLQRRSFHRRRCLFRSSAALLMASLAGSSSFRSRP